MTTDWFEHDRNLGAGLPSKVNTSRLARLMSEKRLPRVANVAQAMAHGFAPIDGRPGLFRKGHALWNVRAAEDGNGYVIIRLRDEPAPGIEPRRAQHAGLGGPRRAQHVEVQVHVEPETESESMVIELEDPASPSMLPDDPMLIPLGEVHIAQSDTAPSMGHQSDIGELIEVTDHFSPLLYGGELMIPEGRLFEVVGQSPGTPDADAMVGLELTNPLYPEEDDNPSNFVRLRLRDDESGVEIAVLPLEFERFMSARGIYPKAPIHHRSRKPYRTPSSEQPAIPAPRSVGPDSDVPDIGTRDTQDFGGRDDTVPTRSRRETVPSRPRAV